MDGELGESGDGVAMVMVMVVTIGEGGDVVMVVMVVMW